MTAPLPPERALERLEALCSRSEHCSSELVAKMRTWKLSPDDIEAVIYSLRRRQFVDDSRFARAFVRDKYRFNRWGRIKIRMELSAKKISAELIDEAMEEIDENVYQERLESLLASKINRIHDDDPRIRRQKILRAAVSRGYEVGLAAQRLTAIMKGENNQE